MYLDRFNTQTQSYLMRVILQSTTLRYGLLFFAWRFYIYLAVDSSTGYCHTGDLNFNMLNSQYARKTNSLCQQFSLFQSISKPAHFTENSPPLTDLLLVSNKDRIIFSGVGDPFLHQDLRYHCLILILVYSISLNLKLNVLSVVYGNTTGAIMIYSGRKHLLLIRILFKSLI